MFLIFRQNFFDERFDHIRGFGDRRLHGFAQTHLTLLAAECFRFTADEQNFVKLCAHLMRRPQNVRRVHRMPVEHRRNSVRIFKFAQVGFDDIKRSRRVAVREGINKNRHIKTVKKRVSQIVTANPVIEKFDIFGQFARLQNFGDLASETVIAEKNIADTGDENSSVGLKEFNSFTHSSFSSNSFGTSGSTSSSAKKNLCPGWRSIPISLPGSSSNTTAR